VSGSTTLHLVIQDVTRKAVSKLPAKLATRKSLGVSPSLVIFLKQVEASCEAGWVRSTPANRSVTVVQHRMNDVIFAALDNIGIAGQSPFALLLLCFSSFLSLGVTFFRTTCSSGGRSGMASAYGYIFTAKIEVYVEAPRK
jgi:hypothetical protein